MLIYCSVIMKVLSSSRHLRKLDNVDISLSQQQQCSAVPSRFVYPVVHNFSRQYRQIQICLVPKLS